MLPIFLLYFVRDFNASAILIKLKFIRSTTSFNKSKCNILSVCFTGILFINVNFEGIKSFSLAKPNKFVLRTRN